MTESTLAGEMVQLRLVVALGLGAVAADANLPAVWTCTWRGSQPSPRLWCDSRVQNGQRVDNSCMTPHAD